MKCEVDEQLVIGNYRFQPVLPNSFSEYFDEILIDKIRNLMGESGKIV